jgi:selenocysteine lyase/cysteine desulfurase
MITPVGQYAFVGDARRWETGGTANYPGAIGLAASVELINQIGIENVGRHVLSLTDHLIAALHQRHIQVVTPEEPQHRSGIVTFTLEEPRDNLALTRFLQEHKVLVSVRYTSGVGGVRVSCHLFNTTDDLDRLMELTGAFVERHAKANT